MDKAKELIEQSGTAGQKVTFISTTDEVGKAIGNYMVGLLNELGYEALFRALGGGPQYEYIQNSKNNVQISYSSWYQDYPAGIGLHQRLRPLNPFVPNSNASPNIAGFCDDKIDSEIKVCAAGGGRRSGRREHAVGADRQGDHRPGSLGRNVQPQADRLRLSVSRATSSVRSGTS